MKNIPIIILIFLMPMITLSQGFFLRAAVSSDHSFNPSQFHSPLESIVGSDKMQFSDQTYSQKVSKGTYGEGLTYSIGCGKDINNYVSLVFDINYQKGSGVQDVSTQIPNFRSSQFSRSKTVRVNPSILFSTGNQNRFSGYLRTGMILPVWGKVNSQTIIEDQTGQIYAMLTQEFNPNISTTIHMESNTSGKLSFGFKSSLGLEYQLFKGVSLFSEIEFTNFNIGLNKTQVTAATGLISIPGVADIPLDIDAFPEFIKNINYHDELTADSNYQNAYNNFDPTKALDALDHGSNFNSLGIGIGVKIKL